MLFFVPETKGRTLEELDQVFGVRTRDHAAFGWRQARWAVERYLQQRDVMPPRLFEEDEGVGLEVFDRGREEGEKVV